ncbi:MAG TPA: TIGR01777 family oxidoreductase [Draconibacterium sp.]|nr:TIGR01777 family oxidoreductase [Draconibacterium sp.]
MKIKITGISGYLGQQISHRLTENGHQVSGISRELLYGNSKNLAEEIKNTDVIINLAGSTILQRWTEKNKAKVYNSRVKTTQNLVWSIKKLSPEQYPRKFISASAIGIYQPGELHNEKSQKFEQGFIGKVVLNWEDSVMQLPDSIQKIIFRIGPVLGKQSKTITNLLLPFKLGLGATIGNGAQPFPFIHEEDVSNAFVWAVEKYLESDTFNLVAPERITNKIFTKELAKQLHRPAFLAIPGFILRLLYGKAYVLLTKSPEVEPQKLLKAGYRFEFPTIDATLKNILA